MKNVSHARVRGAIHIHCSIRSIPTVRLADFIEIHMTYERTCVGRDIINFTNKYKKYFQHFNEGVQPRSTADA